MRILIARPLVPGSTWSDTQHRRLAARAQQIVPRPPRPLLRRRECRGNCMRDTIDPKGWDLASYRKNPVNM
jgi:hypothetical protein